MLERLSRTWLILAAILLVVSPLDHVFRGAHVLSDRFMVEQDMPVLAIVTACVLALRLFPALAAGLRHRLERASAAPGLAMLVNPGRPGRVALGLAGFCGLTALAGQYAVFAGYPLSLDEFMAVFGAEIHRHGGLLAPVPPMWRPFAQALQPQLSYVTPTRDAWASAYLPVNAMLRGAAAAVGADRLVSALLAAVSVVAVYAVGRRIWPDRPGVALAAAVLLASSSQLLVTAMTPYAMTAHLAFNLVWLWLFLRGGRLGHAGALAVGFLACGLHQLLFHPLFAAPFVLQLWLERRWRAAMVYTVAYAGICLFWIDYWPIALTSLGPAAAHAATAPAGGAIDTSLRSGAGFFAGVTVLLKAFSPAAFGLMSKNLLRFVLWQNPLVAPLLTLGAVGALRAGGTVRYLMLGMILAVAAILCVLPYQGHGWGYRYLHGFLGSAALIAASGWVSAADRLSETGGRTAWLALWVTAAFSVVVLLPVRAWQAYGFAHPYVLADAAIRRTPVDLVVLDDNDAWFIADLIRNDPYLSNRPKVMYLGLVSDSQLRDLCARRSIAVFDRVAAGRFGIGVVAPPPEDRPALDRVRRVKSMVCGPPGGAAAVKLISPGA